MPWKEQSLETMREEFVKRVLAHEKSKSALCLEYGISRPTGDKWIARYVAGEKMKDLSRAPKSRPNKIDPEVERKIVEYRKQYPAVGAVKMRRIMENDHYAVLPSARTFNEVLRGMDSSQKKQARQLRHMSILKKRIPTKCGRGISRDILRWKTELVVIH